MFRALPSARRIFIASLMGGLLSFAGAGEPLSDGRNLFRSCSYY